MKTFSFIFHHDYNIIAIKNNLKNLIFLKDISKKHFDENF